MPEPLSMQPSRWWEEYAIRYGVGTVVGGVIFFILCSFNESLQPFLFGASADNFSTSHIVLLGVYGFAYCYLASAPILVFHASRWLSKPDNDLDDLLIKLLITLSLPLIFAQVLHDHIPITDSSTKGMLWSSAFLLALIVWLQILAIVRSAVSHRDLFDFYAKLAKKRESSNAQLIESYRHLREHGNAFFVVFMEIAFAAILQGVSTLIHAVAPNPSPEGIAIAYVGVVVIWISPAVAVWLIGNTIERTLADS